jgi:hypothetical protein
MKKVTFYCITILMLAISCEKQKEFNPVANVVTDSLKKTSLVNNDQNSLDQRISTVTNSNVYVFVDSTKNDTNGTATSKCSCVPTLKIQLIAKMASPVYNNPITGKQEVLQANHIRVVGDYAYIGYNTQGPRYLGGIDIVDISSPVKPRLTSSVIFINPTTNEGKDVSSIDVEQEIKTTKCNPVKPTTTYVWIAGAEENNPLLPTPAILEKFELNSLHQFQNTNARVYYALNGNVGTDVRVINDKVYATSGIYGGLSVLDLNTNNLTYTEVTNARSVDVNSTYEIVLGGDPGTLNSFNPTPWTAVIGGATDPEAKSIIRLYEKFVLAALGENGVKCFDLSSNTPSTVVSSLPAPTSSNGDGSEYVTNGVSISDGWVYIANGAGGLDIATLDKNGHLKLLGNINLGTSVNFVEASSTYLFVATGLGGLNILKITESC